MKKSVLRRLISQTRPYRLFMGASLLCAAASVFLTLLGPILIGRAIDLLVGPGQVDFSGILWILLLFLGTLLGSALFGWLMGLLNNTVSYRTTQDLRSAAFAKMNAASLRFIDSRAHGDLIGRVTNDINQIGDGLLQGFTQLFTGIVTILGTLILMLTIHPLIMLIVVLITPLSIFVASFIVRKTHKYYREQTITQGELSGYVNEMIENSKLVYAFCRQEQTQAEFEKINTRLHRCGIRAQFFSSMSNPCTRFVNGIVYAAVGIAGAIGAIQGFLSVGQISVFLSYANQYTKPFNEVTGILHELQTALASARRIYELLDEPEEPKEPLLAHAAATPPTFQGQVEIRDISFSYTPQVPLISHFSLTVAPGSMVAIVGPTGCGKTTLVNLLMRFYEVDAGSILIDGQDIRSLPLNVLRGLFGMVLQETWLSGASIRDNIAYGKPQATDEEIIKAARAAKADRFIRQLPQGYHTLVGENGGNLSEGQRQLLSIARVMLLDPPMLILDEATSNIDTRTEIFISRAFSTMMKGRTTFVIAHRLSTIRKADTILVMNQGHIVEQGTHEALLRQNGFYANLYKSQFQLTE